jgi:hypothetical protein
MSPSTSSGRSASRLAGALALGLSLAAAGCGGVAHLIATQLDDDDDSRPASGAAGGTTCQILGPLARSAFTDPERILVTYRVTAEVATVDVAIDVAPVAGDGTIGAFETAVEAVGDPLTQGRLNLPIAGGSGTFTFVWLAAQNLGLEAASRSVVLRVQPATGGTGQISAPFLAGNAPPVVSVAPPTARSANIPILLDIADAELDLASLDVFYVGLDGSINTATASVPGLTTNLTTDPDGVVHVYIWNSSADLPRVTTAAAELQFRARDSETGPLATVTFPLENNTPPIIAVDQPRGTGLAGPIAIDYRLFDAEDDACDLEVEFSEDSGRTFRPATPAARSTHDGTRAIPALGGAGTRSTFVWDSAADLGPGRVPSVRLRLQAADAAASGNVEEVTFDVDNTPVVEDSLGGTILGGLAAELDADGQADLLTIESTSQIAVKHLSR